MKKLLSILIFGYDGTRIIKTYMEYNRRNVNRLGAIYHDEEYSDFSLSIKEHPLFDKYNYVIFNDLGKISFRLRFNEKIVIKLMFLGLFMLPLQVNNFDFTNFWVKSYIIVYFISNTLTLLNQYKNEQIINIIVKCKEKMTNDEQTHKSF